MNWLLILFLLIIAGGLFFLFKKMKVGKGDFNKLKYKITKNKLSLAEIEFDKGNILIPIDKRDYADLNNFREGIKNNPELTKKLNNIDSEFKKWIPLKIQEENK